MVKENGIAWLIITRKVHDDCWLFECLSLESRLRMARERKAIAPEWPLWKPLMLMTLVQLVREINYDSEYLWHYVEKLLS